MLWLRVVKLAVITMPAISLSQHSARELIIFLNMHVRRMLKIAKLQKKETEKKNLLSRDANMVFAASIGKGKSKYIDKQYLNKRVEMCPKATTAIIF